MTKGYIVLVSPGLIEIYHPLQTIDHKVNKNIQATFVSNPENFGRFAIPFTEKDIVVGDNGKGPRFARFSLLTNEYTITHGPAHPLDKQENSIAITGGSGKIYCCGGLNSICKATTDMYCLRQNANDQMMQWEKLNSINQARAYSSAVVFQDACTAEMNILVTGGQGTGDGSSALHSAEVYHCNSDEWLNCAAMRHGRSLSAACCDAANQIVLSGGAGNINAEGNTIKPEQVTSTCERYDAQNDVWHPMASMIHARCGHQLVLFQREIYAIGGKNEIGEILHSVERYDADEEEWELLENETTEEYFCFGAAVSEQQVPERKEKVVKDVVQHKQAPAFQPNTPPRAQREVATAKSASCMIL